MPCLRSSYSLLPVQMPKGYQEQTSQAACSVPHQHDF